MNEGTRKTRPHHTESEILSVWGDPNHQDELGFGALHRALKAGKPDPYVIAVLAKYTSNINMRDKRHRTPLHWAAQLGHLDIVLLLLELGADPKAKDVKGLTAAQRTRSPEIKAIIEHPEAEGSKQPLSPRPRPGEGSSKDGISGHTQTEEDLKKIAAGLTAANEQLKNRIDRHHENEEQLRQAISCTITLQDYIDILRTKGLL